MAETCQSWNGRRQKEQEINGGVKRAQETGEESIAYSRSSAARPHLPVLSEVSLEIEVCFCASRWLTLVLCGRVQTGLPKSLFIFLFFFLEEKVKKRPEVEGTHKKHVGAAVGCDTLNLLRIRKLLPPEDLTYLLWVTVERAQKLRDVMVTASYTDRSTVASFDRPLPSLRPLPSRLAPQTRRWVHDLRLARYPFWKGPRGGTGGFGRDQQNKAARS